VGWGVGGIEAIAAMLNFPIEVVTPDVIGFKLTGALREGVTPIDLTLTITQVLRKKGVVNQFVEFFGPGLDLLSLPERAMIANMSPENGATITFFPVDEQTLSYLRLTGRSAEQIELVESYTKAQHLFRTAASPDPEYSSTLVLDMGTVEPSLAGPRKPEERTSLQQVGVLFRQKLSLPLNAGGFAVKPEELERKVAVKLNSHAEEMGHGAVVIAAITSCTNTSNPGVLLAAGLLAKKAVAKGLRVKPHIKTTLAPGSRVVTEYLTNAGLLPYLEQMGFSVAAYGCTTCIGNSGPLDAMIEEVIVASDLIAAAVLSGNRNFEARIHANIKANFLASPPLVVAYAIAGKMNINLDTEPLGTGKDGKPVYLKDIWPSSDEVQAVMKYAADPAVYRRLYSDLTKDLPLWNAIAAPTGNRYQWDDSTYIARPPFFEQFGMQTGSIAGISNAKPLAIFGDSVTTDHISPAGSFKSTTPAGKYLLGRGVAIKDFNSYGARRGNHEVMMRGTFANVRVKNLMLPPNADGSRIEGGYTLYKGEQTAIYDAAMKHISDGTPTVIFAGEEYGTGSSRDWAAKGTQLLGVKAVIAKSYERIHRSNLVGMGVLPLQFKGDTNVARLNLTGEETFDISGIDNNLKPQQDVTLTIRRKDGSTQQVPLLLRIDTPIEVDYYRHGGILPYVLRELVSR
jgi:aconitate hydratase